MPQHARPSPSALGLGTRTADGLMASFDGSDICGRKLNKPQTATIVNLRVWCGNCVLHACQFLEAVSICELALTCCALLPEAAGKMPQELEHDLWIHALISQPFHHLGNVV